MKDIPDKEIIEVFALADVGRQNQVIKYMYLKYFPVILNYILKNNGTEEDAADIFQDSMVVFYRKANNKKFELSCTVKTYLYSVSKKMWLYRLRSRKKEVVMDNDFTTIPIEDDTLKVLIKEDHKILISQLMEKLGSKCRDILTYVYFDRLKMEEIAERMKISSAQVVRNQKSACMKKLKAMIENSEELKNNLK